MRNAGAVKYQIFIKDKIIQKQENMLQNFLKSKM